LDEPGCTLRVQLQTRRGTDRDRARGRLLRHGPKRRAGRSVLVLATPIFFAERQRVEAGGLMSYYAMSTVFGSTKLKSHTTFSCLTLSMSA
jgi:hypothetical protein